MIEMYCITCPNGCLMQVNEESNPPVVEGNACKRGADFAVTELTNPTRTLTSTVRTSFPGIPVLPVRTDGEIPKKKIMEVMQALSSVVVRQPLDCGDTVVGNAAGTGVRIIATSDSITQYVREQQEKKAANKDQKPGGGDTGVSHLGTVFENAAEADADEEKDAAEAKSKEAEDKKPSRGRAMLRP